MIYFQCKDSTFLLHCLFKEKYMYFLIGLKRKLLVVWDRNMNKNIGIHLIGSRHFVPRFPSPCFVFPTILTDHLTR